MKSGFRCSAAARAACEFRKFCGEEATFFEGSQCYDFNHEIESKAIVKTNADHIRAMSDEELAEYFAALIDEANSGSVIYSNESYDWLEWLQQPVKEDS